jgi:glutamate synthase (NADPH/NADH) small chain
MMGKITGFKEFSREVPKDRPAEQRIKDFKEVHEKFPIDKLKQQAARCMDCGTPFCSWACPLGNICPDWNDLVYKDKWQDAFKRLYLTSNFPEFTGRICPALCEGSCTLGDNNEAVTIKEVEVNIIERAFKEGIIKPNPPKVRTGKNIAVVGSGPAGLAAANELNSVGHNVTLFERADEIGGLLRYGIPDFKLEKHVIDRRVKLMEEEGITFKTNANVGVNYPTEKLLEEFDAVVLTGGSTIPRDLQVPGRELDGVHFAMDFLTQQNRRVSGKAISENEISAKDKVVVVIGGGDTGSDCIGTSIRQGAKAVYQYEIMPKPSLERDETMPWPLFPRTLKTSTSHEEGCTRDWCVTTQSLEGKEGKLTTLNGARVKWETDKNGRMSMVEVPGSEFKQDVDLVLLAMGFVHPQQEGMLKDLGVEFDQRGNVAVDEDYKTNKEKVFAAGDMRKGQSLVVWAIHEGREAAKSVDKYLMGETSLRG